MKRIIFLIVILTINFNFSQENKIRFKSFDYGVVGLYSNLKKDGPRGLCTNLDFSMVYNQNILSAYTAIGYGTNYKDGRLNDLQGILELGLLYGREFKIADDFNIETATGLSYIFQGSVCDEIPHREVGLPVKVKFLFYTSKKFALGINPAVNINKYRTLYSTSFLLRFDF
jgi:hypothetical protein